MFNVSDIRKQFPILKRKINGKNLIYFDNAATTQKPRVMIDALVEYYENYNANIHRGVHTLSQEATEKYENVRNTIKNFLHVSEEYEIIFTKNDTESINIVAYGCIELITEESNIVLTDLEHHSNIVPWQILRKYRKFETRYAKFTNEGYIDIDDLVDKVDQNTKIVSISYVSNTFGSINDVETIIRKIRQKNPDAIIIVDGAQACGHFDVNITQINTDFFTFSAHKCLGPTGVGILIGKKTLLQEMTPLMGGGDMIKTVTRENTTYADIPYKFEAGTPNIADVIAFDASIKFIQSIGVENIKVYEEELTKYMLEKLLDINFLTLYGSKSHKKRLPIFSFNIEGVHSHDVGTILDDFGIAIRTGHNCTQIIMNELKVNSVARASLCFYNTMEEIDIFINALKEIKKIFR
ncbi:MAG: SufS family cysteine desulfurase [Candidatus Dojkabacteria bacterium]|nr:SufS family cysteine desulfurase [Candidatus Dojkabacteria bacterium]